MTELLTTEGALAHVVELVHGAAAICALGHELDALVAQCRAPITVSSTWTMSRLAHEAGTPWAVLVRDAAGGLAAAAVLLEQNRGAITLAGGGHGHRVALPARDLAAARSLADALGRELRRHPRELNLGPMAADDATLALVDALHPHVTMRWVDPIPAVRKTDGPQVAQYLSAGSRRTIRKAGNRLAADGRYARTSFTRDPGAVQEVLPELAEAYVDRDRHHGLVSELDDATGYLRWRERVLRLARTGLLEVAVLYIDDVLGAYLIGLYDDTTYRVLEGRFVSSYARYAPGRLLEMTVVQRFLDHPDLSLLDWMTGVAPEALIAMNDAESMVLLTVPAGGGR